MCWWVICVRRSPRAGIEHFVARDLVHAQWHRIHAAHAERVTARQASRREPHADQCAMCAHGLGRVARTRGVKPAPRARPSDGVQHRRQQPTIKPQQREQREGGQTDWGADNPAGTHGRKQMGRRAHADGGETGAEIFRQASARRRSSSANGSRPAAARATRMRSRPAGARSCCRRNASRRRRLARLRATAPPTAARDATKPARAGPGS